jgi:lipopolysaccharide assembly outer membrane protein LptD (OstA)
VIVDGDEVEYFDEEKTIVARGNVIVKYGETTLTCDTMILHTDTSQVLCEGNVVIDRPGKGTLTGDRIRYDLIREKGELLEGDLKAFPWFGAGEEFKKTGKNEYYLRNSYLSTCDLDQPHYRLKAKEAWVYPDDKIIAKDVVIYIGRLPVFRFPYYYHPFVQGRPKVQFIYGQEKDWGRFILSAWRFYIKDDTKFDIIVDYRSQKGWAEGANVYYYPKDFGLRGLGEGMFRAYIIHENRTGTYDKTPWRDEWRDKERSEGVDPKLRYLYQWKHQIEFEPETIGTLECNRYSDSYVLQDYYYNEYERTPPTGDNYVTVISSKPNYMINIEANRRFNNYRTVTQKLPQLKMNVPKQQLWDTPFYYNSEISGTSFDKVFAIVDGKAEDDPQLVKRFDTLQELTYAGKLGPVEVTPYVKFRETFYSRTAVKAQSVSRGQIGAGVEASMRIWRIFNVNTDLWGLNINRLRHIIVPKVRYDNMQKPTIDSWKFYQMDEIDNLSEANGVDLSLENKLQTKSHGGDGMSSRDLIRFIASTRYNFRMKKNWFEFDKTNRFSDFNFNLELRPYDWFFVNGIMELNSENYAVNTINASTSVDMGDTFQLTGGYRYEKLMPHSRNLFIIDGSYKINPRLRIGVYERFDVQLKTIEEQQLSLNIDLHCWELEVVYNVDGSRFFYDEFSLWFAFKVKAFPDLQVGLKRMFSRRPPGSLSTTKAMEKRRVGSK